MARAALGWSLNDLRDASGLGRATLARFELDSPVADATLATICATYEREGVEFIERGTHRGGVVPPLEGR
jgi:transcriptional regulator with XRE-family HTH domain